jgi:hypothetical protein
MVSNRVAIGAVALACVTAAGGGAYFASRQNAVELAARVPVSVAPQPEAAAKPASVAETEAIVGESAASKAAESSAAKAPQVAEAPEAPAPPAAVRPSRSERSATAPSPRRGTPNPPARSTSPASAPATSPADPIRQTPAPVTAEADPSAFPSRPAEPPPAADPFPAPAPREPQRTFEELVVASDSVIGLRIETSLTSENARVEDKVEAMVTRDVKVDDRIAIPAGSRMIGSVTQVERGGKIKERARLAVRFHTLVLADGTRVPLSTDTLYRDGPPPAKESAAKIGGATVGGAILGAILGGGKGAAAGAAAGAAGGTAAVMAGDRNPAVLTAGSNVTVRVMSPVTITIEKQ